MIRSLRAGLLALAALAGLLAAPPALAWGALGHRTLAQAIAATVR